MYSLTSKSIVSKEQDEIYEMYLREIEGTEIRVNFSVDSCFLVLFTFFFPADFRLPIVWKRKAFLCSALRNCSYNAHFRVLEVTSNTAEDCIMSVIFRHILLKSLELKTLACFFELWYNLLNCIMMSVVLQYLSGYR